MKLIKINSQNRRDFWGDFECESCGFVEKNKSGYDDDFFHDTATPKFKCPKCGKSRNDLGITGEHVETKYPEGMQV